MKEVGTMKASARKKNKKNAADSEDESKSALPAKRTIHQILLEDGPKFDDGLSLPDRKKWKLPPPPTFD